MYAASLEGKMKRFFAFPSLSLRFCLQSSSSSEACKMSDYIYGLGLLVIAAATVYANAVKIFSFAFA